MGILRKVGNFSKRIELDFSQAEKQLILSILSTYRRAKRFARLFSLNYSSLKGRTSLLEWRDVFWLDMLQMHNKTIYNALCYNRQKLLLEKGANLVYSPDKIKDNSLDDKSNTILLYLWGEKESNSDTFSIRNKDSYYKYFTLEFNLSDEEIDKLLSNNDMEAINIIIQEKGVTFDAVWKRIKQNVEKNTINKQQKMNHLIVLLNICYNGNEFEIGRKLQDIKNDYADTSYSELKLLIIGWVSAKLEKSGNRTILSAIIGEFAQTNLLNREDVSLLIK